MKDLFREIIERTPAEPGVYIMRDARNKIIYIGKATSLKARLRSYFSGSDPRPFVSRLDKILGDVETVITRNEKEAFLLENRLIKAHQPRFNVKLRDDKNYLSLRIDSRTEWPRVQVVRRQRRDGALYFGPYHSASAIRQTLRLINRYFGLRTCSDSVLHNRSRPCLQYQIKRCPGPCVFDIDKQEYDRSVKETVLFLQGRKKELVNSLERRMEGAAKGLAFELAAHYRDQIRDVQRSLMRQDIETVQRTDQDVIGLYREGETITIELIFVRRGVINGTRRFSFHDQPFPSEEILSSFIGQYYSGGVVIPHEVLVPLDLELQDGLEALLTDLRQTRVKLIRPQRGAKRSLLDTAQRNAAQAFREQVEQTHQRHSELEKLQKRLHLKQFPKRIECFDISNLGDTAIVGSMVVFTDGEPDKAAYRTFRVRTVVEQNDFASMYEVLSRRVQRSQKNLEPWPDLVVVDGGKGQLNIALQAFADLGVSHLQLVGLAKSRRDKGTAPDQAGYSNERVFLPSIKDPIQLRPNTAERHLMERIRDEAHRVAISYNRKLRQKRVVASVLDQISGVGQTRKKALLRRFGSVGRLRNASVDDIASVSGIGPALARRIWDGIAN